MAAGGNHCTAELAHAVARRARPGAVAEGARVRGGGTLAGPRHAAHPVRRNPAEYGQLHPDEFHHRHDDSDLLASLSVSVRRRTAGREQLGHYAQPGVGAGRHLLQAEPDVHSRPGRGDQPAPVVDRDDDPIVGRHFQSSTSTRMIATELETPATFAPRPRDPVLSIRDLSVVYDTSTGPVRAVEGASFDLYPGESIALIGESGSGKTTLGLGLLRLLPRSAKADGQVVYRGRDGRSVDVLTLPNDAVRRFRWQECAMVFQAAQNALNPVARVWDHMLDTVRAHRGARRDEVRERCERLLGMVQLEPQRVLHAFPHELSGGMRQRVLIAMSLLLDPQVLILDEPTTALDILTQRAIIEVLRSIRAELHFAMLFISHDLSLAAELADRVATMYAGKVVELGTVRDIFYDPKHPYTLGLIKAVPPVAGDLFEISSIVGTPPNLLNLPPGCSFHPRCAYARGQCTTDVPPLYAVAAGHASACHYWSEVQLSRKVIDARSGSLLPAGEAVPSPGEAAG